MYSPFVDPSSKVPKVHRKSSSRESIDPRGHSHSHSHSNSHSGRSRSPSPGDSLGVHGTFSGSSHYQAPCLQVGCYTSERSSTTYDGMILWMCKTQANQLVRAFR